MSPKGRHKPIHKRIEIIRSFKMTRLMLEQIRAACDENDISFSQFMREAVNQSLSWYNQQKTSYKTQQKVLDPSTSVMA
jgi:DNA-binding transcriptional MerR regulator